MTSEDRLEVQHYKEDAKQELKWVNIVSITTVHFLALYSLLSISHWVLWKTFLWGLFMGWLGGFGVTGGAHRFWTHNSFKAKWPLRVIFAICYSTAGQNSLYDWVRDHRLHHKFSETNADPHNSKRGFFFSHVGWLMQKKHPEVLRLGKLIDMSDLLADPVFVFHQKHFTLLKMIFCFIIPISVPPLVWNETWYNSFMGIGVLRYVLLLNATWLVNSAAHIWGNKPYNRKISPAENRTVAILALGEGWHNYHHMFPWDYKAAELGHYRMNFTTALIDLFSFIGWAYDLRIPTTEMVRRAVEKKGDGTHSKWTSSTEEMCENADRKNGEVSFQNIDVGDKLY